VVDGKSTAPSTTRAENCDHDKSAPVSDARQTRAQDPAGDCGDYTIITTFGMEYRAWCSTTLMAGDVWS